MLALDSLVYAWRQVWDEPQHWLRTRRGGRPLVLGEGAHLPLGRDGLGQRRPAWSNLTVPQRLYRDSRSDR